MFTNENQNPYVNGSEGRREWNDRYMNMSSAIRFWQYAFFGIMFIVVLFSGVVAKLAMSSRVQPFVVETSHGMPYAIKSLPSLSSYDQRLINFAINQFIINAKTILNDVVAERALLDKVYAYSANQTIGFLHDFYQKNNPFELSAHYQVQVKIINAFPLSKNTWQIVWDEEKHIENQIDQIQVSRWMANVTYKFGEVNKKFIMNNPFGLYITQVYWSQSHDLS